MSSTHILHVDRVLVILAIKWAASFPLLWTWEAVHALKQLRLWKVPSNLLLFRIIEMSMSFKLKGFHEFGTLGPIWYMCLKTKNCCLKTQTKHPLSLPQKKKSYDFIWNLVKFYAFYVIFHQFFHFIYIPWRKCEVKTIVFKNPNR